MNRLLPFLAGLMIVSTISCKKDAIITSGDVSVLVSSDTLHFDTVFTSTGSVTQFFKIYNANNGRLLINNISISNPSYFKINADGIAGPSVSGLEVDANDSLYVFVTVKIDPGIDDLPFVVTDSVHIVYNGIDRWVQLEAWGQNANFVRSKKITANEHWTNTKPYVILGGLQIDEGAELTIDPGTRIYVHADAPILVDGSLRALGEKYDSTRVIFQGDRLDVPYKNFPAAWPGIFFRETSHDNLLRYAIVQNAYQGVVCDKPSTNANPKLGLEQVVIRNCYDAALLGIASDAYAVNCLIENSGRNVVFVKGGSYQMTNCTVAAVSTSYIQHKEPVLLVADFVKEGNSYVTNDLVANFTNCIFWGDNSVVENEIVANKLGTGTFSAVFNHCLWKAKTDIPGISSSNTIINEDPMFVMLDFQKRIFDFHLQEGSPALDKGAPAGLSVDLDGNTRDSSTPDLGAYEKQ